MLSKFEVWIRSLDCVDVDHGGCDKVGVEGRCGRYSKLGFLAGGCYDACVEVVRGTGRRALAANLPIVLLGAQARAACHGVAVLQCTIVTLFHNNGFWCIQRAIMKKRRISARAKSPLQVNPNRKRRDWTGCCPKTFVISPCTVRH